MGRRGSPSPSGRSGRPFRSMPTRPAFAPPPVVQPQQPSMLKQVAATAAGVAVGSAVGHAVGNALVGGSSAPETAMAHEAPVAPATEQASTWNPCRFQIDQLISCSQMNSDIAQCQPVADALRDCRRMYNLQ